MSKIILHLEKPVAAKIILLRENNKKIEGILGNCKITDGSKYMWITGSVLVDNIYERLMVDDLSKSPKGLFDLRVKTANEIIDLQRCIGTSCDQLWLNGRSTSSIHFAQKCIQSHLPIEADSSEYIDCPTEPENNASLGDLYFDRESMQIKMKMTDGWFNIATINNIENFQIQRLDIPMHSCVFQCQKLESRKWHRNIESRRAKKVLELKNRRLRK